MDTGTVKMFNSTKGFGFISPDNGGEELFVHFKEIQMEGYKKLLEGQRVSYVAVKGAKGMQATQVQLLNGAN